MEITELWPESIKEPASRQISDYRTSEKQREARDKIQQTDKPTNQ